MEGDGDFAAGRNLISAQFTNVLNRKNTFEGLKADDVNNPTFNNKKLWVLLTEGIIGFNENSYTTKICNDNREQINNKINDVLHTDDVLLKLCKDIISKLNGSCHANPTIVANDTATNPIDYINSLHFKNNPVGNFLMNVLEKNSTVKFIEECKYGSPFSRSWKTDSHTKGQILFSDSNTYGGATIPLKNILEGATLIADTSGSTLNTIPRIKQKMLCLINNI